ncbi:MAG: hypothetical protein ACOVQ4_11985 [Flectobacillus sp.]|uniref:hypothetical protein n=1 Tax=Flectobacillus sp. TaxID=50419 RepID=UPI003B9CB980
MLRFFTCISFILLILSSCGNKRTPLQDVEKHLNNLIDEDSSKTVIIISDIDCVTCLEYITPKLDTLSKPLLGIFLASQKKSNKNYSDWINETRNKVKWQTSSDIPLANSLTILLANNPKPSFFEFRNKKIVRWGTL